jgi:p21-activated kinase 1
MDMHHRTSTDNTNTTTDLSSTTFTSLSSKRRRNTLTKNPPPSAFSSKAGSLRKQQSAATLSRAPSAPSPYRSQDTSASQSTRDVRFRSQSNANNYGSSTSSLERPALLPSQSTQSIDFFSSAAVNGFQLSQQYPLTPQISDDRHNDLIGAPFDASGLLSSIQATSMNDTQDAGGVPAPVPGALTQAFTSPDLRSQSHPLRTSQTYASGAIGMMEVTPPKSDGTMSPKRFSGDGHVKPAGPFRKKSGFSSFMNNMRGSPRTIKISAPENPMHMIHVGYDNQTGQFTVSFPIHCLKAVANMFLRDYPRTGSAF